MSLELIWNLLTVPAFTAFIMMLVALMVIHHHKTLVVIIGFLALSAMYVSRHGWKGLGQHFAAHHEFHSIAQHRSRGAALSTQLLSCATLRSTGLKADALRALAINRWSGNPHWLSECSAFSKPAPIPLNS